MKKNNFFNKKTLILACSALVLMPATFSAQDTNSNFTTVSKTNDTQKESTTVQSTDNFTAIKKKETTENTHIAPTILDINTIISSNKIETEIVLDQDIFNDDYTFSMTVTDDAIPAHTVTIDENNDDTKTIDGYIKPIENKTDIEGYAYKVGSGNLLNLDFLDIGFWHANFKNTSNSDTSQVEKIKIIEDDNTTTYNQDFRNAFTMTYNIGSEKGDSTYFLGNISSPDDLKVVSNTIDTEETTSTEESNFTTVKKKPHTAPLITDVSVVYNFDKHKFDIDLTLDQDILNDNYTFALVVEDDAHNKVVINENNDASNTKDGYIKAVGKNPNGYTYQISTGDLFKHGFTENESYYVSLINTSNADSSVIEDVNIIPGYENSNQFTINLPKQKEFFTSSTKNISNDASGDKTVTFA